MHQLIRSIVNNKFWLIALITVFAVLLGGVTSIIYSNSSHSSTTQPPKEVVSPFPTSTNRPLTKTSIPTPPPLSASPLTSLPPIPTTTENFVIDNQPIPPLANHYSAIKTCKITLTDPTNFASKSVKHGHFRYAQAEANQLVYIASYATGEYQRFECLHLDAAKALMKMISAAREQGVWIIPVSGFRNYENQAQLFQAQIQRKGSEKEAARVSAPVGYSEHHTGFAVDLADGSVLGKDVSQTFENTQAFQWLTKNARRFGFELSFPRYNKQQISYEPWHWRYIGSQSAQAIFYGQNY